MSPKVSAEHVVILSAPAEPVLRRYARELLGHLAEPAGDGVGSDLGGVAFTLQTGRVAMAHRLAVTAADLSGVTDGLAAYLDGRPHPGLGTAVVDATRPPDSMPADEIGAGAQWLDGQEVPWRRYWPEPPARVSLPPLPWGDELASPVEPACTAEPAPRASTAGRAAAERYLIDLYAEVSGIPAGRLRPNTALAEIGLSSFLVNRMNARLQDDLGETDRTLFFTYPDLAGVASDLVRGHPERWASEPEDPRPPPRPTPARTAGPGTGDGAADGVDPDGAVAIVGIAGRYPRSPDLARFWENLAGGLDCVGPLPPHRASEGWPTDLMWGGFLDEVDTFDPLLFGISPRDAAFMDPQERLFLEVVWEGMEDAGYTRARLRERHDSKVAVYVGAMYNEYPFFGVEQSSAGDRHDSGATLGGIANRVSFFLDLHGPSLSLDTMCSSSLTALHLAMRTLRSGESQVAIVGAVNLSLHPNKFVQLRRMQLDATDHRCRSFGAGGDGFVPAEGAGVVILKPLDRAVADGDRIHAVIRGTSVVHAGRTNGYLVPNPDAQGDMVTAALRDAGVDPGTIGYIEAHGAGTALGDPVEIKGLTRAFGGADLPPGAIPIGSVKSTVGHVEAAAGLAGLTKIVLQMRHRELAPSLHAAELNPNISWDAVPFRVQQERSPWLTGATPRRAGISSFGAGGTLAHAVIEEPPAARLPAPEPASAQLMVLSAYDGERLRELAGRMVAAVGSPEGRRSRPPVDPERLSAELARLGRGELPPELAGVGADGAVPPSELANYLLRTLFAARPDADRGRPELADVAYTLQVGREPLRERLAMVVSDVDTWCARLTEFAAGGSPDGIVRGRVPGTGADAEPGRGTDQLDLAALATAWVGGGSVEWERLHQGSRRRRIVDLPHYPFARMRCWLPDRTPPAHGPADLGAPAPHHDETPLYERVWVPADPIGASAPAEPLVCVFSPHSEEVATAISRMAGAGRVVLVREGADLDDGTPGFVTTTDAVELVEDVLTRHPDLGGWLDITDLHRPEAERGLWQARLAMLQRLVGHAAPRALRVLHVTSGLQALDGVGSSLAGARMAGFVRMLGAENRRLSASVLDTDVPPGDPDQAAGRIMAEWADADAAFGEVCDRRGDRHRPGLRPLRAPYRELQADPRGAYVVTGGTRGIGARVARFLVDRGARRLALLGVHPVDPSDGTGDDDRAVALRALRDRGVKVLVHAGPLTDRIGLGGFLEQVRAELGPLSGVVHCAGRAGSAPSAFASVDLHQIQQVLEPKTDGLETFLELTADDRPAFVTLFSSVCAAVPALAVGVSDYAAANAFLDFTAAHRGGSGQPAFHAVNWPQWAQSGGGRGQPNPGVPMGLAALDDDEALRVLERVLALPSGTRVLPVPPLGETVDVDALIALRRPAAEGPEPDRARSHGDPPDPAGTTSTAIGSLRPADWLVEIFADALHIPAATLDTSATFGDLGVESIMLGELLNAVEGRLRRPLEPAVMLEHPTLDQLGAFLGAESSDVVAPEPGDRTATPGAAEPTPAPSRSRSDATDRDRVAVIGMACRFPQAPDVDTFWSNLQSGRSAVTEVPRSRWDHREWYRATPQIGFSISKWGGFVDDIAEFDPDFFGLSDDEASALDPAIRMMLETTASCMHDAGYPAAELEGQDVGVFVGARMSDYGRRAGVRPHVLRSDQNFIAAYVAHHFDFHGPNLVVDSACSSSLVGVQLAIRSLLAGESTMAVAGGVEVLLDERDYIDLSAARALSPSGRCATFDERADGFVPGEGCGVVLLKPLAAALADGDRVYAVIDGVAVNNDGRTMGVTTPNPRAQAQVVEKALATSGRRPDEITMIEAHGTGTMIGDPIELRALTDAFGGPTAERAAWCAIGSVKSNLGHLLSAAGIAGLLKVALSLHHGEIPPTLFCERPNPRFDFARSPFFPVTSGRMWNAEPGSRVAGLSSFGMGGTNAHLIASGLDPALRNGQPPARPKLAPPAFRRRRLWLDRPGDEPGSSMVSSILDLQLTTS